jgi:Zn-dependent peptidase ImmA (M78 family)
MYVPQYNETQYRKSEVLQHSITSITSWLRIGELEMRKLQLTEYNKDGFKEVITKLKEVVREHPDDFATKIQHECANVGVAVIYTPCMPKAPISGAARWIGGNPLIQLSDRYKSNDHFWFTFYHEAAHVLLHGKKDVFLEDIEGCNAEEEREVEANNFAARWLLPERFINDLEEPLTDKNIIQVAAKYGTHPGIVVGRLQKLKRIDYSFGNHLKHKVSLFK